MRVFVLCTGRCGSTTLIAACRHLTNYTAGHETRARRAGGARFDYPDQHIEADNRLAWFLGELDRRYGNEPLYLHLRRDPDAVARSFLARWDNGAVQNIIRAFANGVILRRTPWPEDRRLAVCRFYVSTVTANVEAFLRDKPRQATVWLEEADEWFPSLWDRIGGDGDLDAALAEFAVHHNATAASTTDARPGSG